MTDATNASQARSWNGDDGRRWAARADQRDRFLAPVADALLRAAAPLPGTRVLDVGCGCGVTTLAAADMAGSAGSATGVDISTMMLDVARGRARAAGSVNTTFVLADAQEHQFAPQSVDLVISRFGTMFFSDIDVAFANIATSMSSGGRLCVATWRPISSNEWLSVPADALWQDREPPPAHDGGGMFAQSDPDRVAETLRGAGLDDITVEAVDVIFTSGETVDDAVDYLTSSGPARAVLDLIADGPDREAALAALRDELASRSTGNGVQLGGGIWLARARRR